MWVHTGRWNQPWVAVVAHDDFPLAGMDLCVARRAEQATVVEIGCAAIDPVLDMVHVRPRGRRSAFDAAFVADRDSLAQVWWEQSFGVAHLEWHCLAIDDDFRE